MRRNAEEFSSDDATPGMIEADAAVETNPEVTPEQQEKLAQQQDAGVGTESGTPEADPNDKNEES